MTVASALSRSPLGRLLGLAPPQLVGSLDEPGPRQPYARTLDVRGWAFSTDGDPVDVVIEIDGRAVWESSPRVTRPDVAALFPKVASAPACGFYVQLDSEALPASPEALLVVRARLAGRTDAQEIGRSIVTRHTQIDRDFARADYAQVWDKVSQTEVAARTSVCGTADKAEWARSGEATAGDVRDLAGVTPADNVLEIGCGAGRVGRFLAPHCRQWTGGDVSQNMLRFATESLADLPNVSTALLNGYDLTGIADGSQDVVYCTGVFMHLDEWERYRYVKDARRVLRPGGRLYIDNFNLLEPEGWAIFLDLFEMDPLKRPANVSRHSTPQELEAYVTHAGFTGVRVRTGGLWVTVVAAAP
jgi:SAM-dependent methyltransferase